jgi:dihydropteroate synthase
MHRKGSPETMQNDPVYEDVVTEIFEFLSARADAAEAAGVSRARILVDPGIGFGKTMAHNLELLGRLGEFRSLGLPVLIGTSRKSFLGRLTGRPVEERLPGTAASVAAAIAAGAAVVRVHDVRAIRDVCRVCDAVAAAGGAA